MQNNPITSVDPTGMADEKPAGYAWGLFYGYVRANSGNLLDYVVTPSSVNRGPGFNEGERDGTMGALFQAGLETGAGLTATGVGSTAALVGAPVGGVGAIPGGVVAGVGIAGAAHGALVGVTAMTNLQSGPTGAESGGAANEGSAPRSEGPVYKTDTEAGAAAKGLGYSPTKEKSMGAKVFERSGKGDGPKYITRDRTGHNGGAFKGADRAKDLGSRGTRSGTYDKKLKRVGD